MTIIFWLWQPCQAINKVPFRTAITFNRNFTIIAYQEKKNKTPNWTSKGSPPYGTECLLKKQEIETPNFKMRHPWRLSSYVIYCAFQANWMHSRGIPLSNYVISTQWSFFSLTRASLNIDVTWSIYRNGPGFSRYWLLISFPCHVSRNIVVVFTKDIDFFRFENQSLARVWDHVNE